MEVSNFLARNKNTKSFPDISQQSLPLALIFNLKKPINIIISACNTKSDPDKNHLPALKISDILTARLATRKELVKIL